MKKRSARPSATRHHQRRFGERQISADDETPGVHADRPLQLAGRSDAADELADEVESNALVDNATAIYDVIRPYTRAILLGLAGALLAAVAWILVSSQQAALQSQGWDAYLAAVSSGDPAALNEVTTRHAGTPAADWSRLMLAEMSLEEGTQLLFADRDRALPRLQSAVDLYAGILSDKPQAILAERATFGIDFPTSALAGMARQRSKALAGDSATEWYSWFAAQKMTPPVPPAAAAETGASETGADAAPAAPADGAVPPE